MTPNRERAFREIHNKLDGEETHKEGTEREDNAFYFGELYRQRMALVESSLPLRMMRRVFLPYADVSERMTNTAGVSNLLPQILRVIPRYMPTNQTVAVTIEGKNFDTGRIDVMVGGHAATDVQVLNEKTIVATVPARAIIADLTVMKRDGRLFNEAHSTEIGKKLLPEIEGIVDVIVVTPAGLASDVALLRITTSIGGETGGAITGSVPDKDAFIVASSLWEQSTFAITLSEEIKETSGTLVLKYDTTKVDLPVDIKGRTVTIHDGVSPSAALLSLVDKEVSNLAVFPQGGHPEGITVNGKLKIEKLSPKAPEKLTVSENGRVSETKFDLDFGKPVKIKSGKLLLTVSGKPANSVSIDFGDFEGTKVGIDLSGDDHQKTIAGWRGSDPGIDLLVTLDAVKREASSAPEKLDCGRTSMK